MRFLGPLLLIGMLGVSGCTSSGRGQGSPPSWTTGFWLWRSVPASRAEVTQGVLFLLVGTIYNGTRPYGRTGWGVSGELPDELPPAREHWLVFRFERQSVPDLAAAPMLARRVAQLRETARQRRLTVAGVQLDIDSPTGRLSEYAAFLREVRKGLPADLGISITALLDWFRDGTGIAEVIREVDEFVPQFYDLAGEEDYRGGTAIAAKIDGGQWAPKFNRFGKRFRIGISTFGRSRIIPNDGSQRSRYVGLLWYRDLTPLDVAVNPAFSLQATRSESEELVLDYRANRATGLGYVKFGRGDAIQFILSTPATVRAAVEQAKKMGKYCAGVVFFRWPGPEEALVMRPGEVLTAAGSPGGALRTPVGVHLVDGGCAAVHCSDVYLENASPFSPRPVRYLISSSAELEYFLPEEGLPVRMSGPSQLELSLPPYCGRGRMYLGRAVTGQRVEFTVEEAR